jgi:hypothetical protein
LIDNFLEHCFGLIRAQPGFKTFPISKKLRKDPKNKEFWDIIDKTNAEIMAIKDNPAEAAVHFNMKTAETYARIIVLCSQVVIPSSFEE